MPARCAVCGRARHTLLQRSRHNAAAWKRRESCPIVNPKGRGIGLHSARRGREGGPAPTHPSHPPQSTHPTSRPTDRPTTQPCSPRPCPARPPSISSSSAESKASRSSAPAASAPPPAPPPAPRSSHPSTPPASHADPNSSSSCGAGPAMRWRLSGPGWSAGRAWDGLAKCSWAGGQLCRPPASPAAATHARHAQDTARTAASVPARHKRRTA